MSGYVICGNVILKDCIKTNAAVRIENGIIKDIFSAEKINRSDNIINAGNGYILPGFIDIHLHGGAGYDFMDADYREFLEIAKIHGYHGTTAMTPTALTAPNTAFEKFFEAYNIASAQEICGSQFVGIHMEGPYISQEQSGAQPKEYIRCASREDAEHFINKSKNKIIRWDAAPELDVNGVLSDICGENGILLSIGHSNATATEALDAYKKGYTHITHLYCATTTEHKVDQVVCGGIIEAAYLEDGFTVELIADGCHIPKETMQLAFKIKGADKVALVTDAMRAAGQNVSVSRLGSYKNGIDVIIENGVAKLPDKSSFAGSIATMDIAFRTAINYGISINDASVSCSLTPARIIGIDNKKGSIEIGKDADIVVMNENYDVTDVFVKGNKIR